MDVCWADNSGSTILNTEYPHTGVYSAHIGHVAQVIDLDDVDTLNFWVYGNAEVNTIICDNPSCSSYGDYFNTSSDGGYTLCSIDVSGYTGEHTVGFSLVEFNPVYIDDISAYAPDPTPTPTPTPTPSSRVMASSTIATVATPHFANVSSYFINGTNETSGPPDFGGWTMEGVNVYVDILGPMAYLLIFFIPFGMIWMANGDTRLLCILGLITGSFVILFLPATWVAAALIIIVISVVTLIWRLMRP